MDTCKTCKHWKLRGEWETGYGLGLGECTRMKMLWDSTEWSEDGDGRVFTDNAEGHKAFLQDGSDYSADLLTKPDFGCIEHEMLVC